LLQYCDGGELYALLNSQPDKRLAESAVRFYASEVLLALQYLHLLGFVYRDLKPENILLHRSGHVTLTDFDLSSCQEAPEAELVPASGPDGAASIDTRDAVSGSGAGGERPMRGRRLLLAAQPKGRANSFVGTEEYLAPEVISGAGHTSMVDWWSFGILIYELLTGTTPFKGTRRDATFENVLTKPLTFPESPVVSEECKDLVRQLLKKDPAKRLGARAGAAEVKEHPWFAGVKWPLVRNQAPPLVPNGGKEVAGAAKAVAAGTGPGHIDGF
jgi:phototropin